MEHAFNDNNDDDGDDDDHMAVLTIAKQWKSVWKIKIYISNYSNTKTLVKAFKI